MHDETRSPGSTLAITVTTLALFFVTTAVNLQSPLYPTYARAAGYGQGSTALMFSLYVAGLLPILIFLGGLSDRIGRKPSIVAGLTASMLATLIMIVRPTMSSLFAARVLQGMGVGMTMGASTAYLTELMAGNTARASRYVAITSSLGFGSGALLTSLVLMLGLTLTPVSYQGIFVLGMGCWLVLLWKAPAFPPRGGVLLRPPYLPAGTFGAAAAIAAAWAISGVVVAIVPAQLMLRGLQLWSGPVLFVVIGVGALCTPWARHMAPRRSLLVGLALLPVGCTLLFAGAHLGTLPMILAGAALAGAAGYGFIYLGGLAEVADKGLQQQARAVTGFFLCAYLGFGLPTIAVGFLADAIGVMAALAVLGVAVVLVSIALFIFFLLRGKTLER